VTSRKPSVVILVENLPVPLDRRAWQEALALHEAGWDVTVISPRGSGEMRRLRDRIDGIEVLRYPQRAARGLAGYLVEYLPSMVFTAAWLIHRRSRGRIDVIHGCNPPDLFWLFGRLTRAEGGAYVFDQHDVGPELATTKWGGRGPRAHALGAVTRWLERRSYRTAELVLAPNDSYRQIAVTRGGVSPDDVLVIRNAPDVARYRELAAGATVDPHRVGYVGVMGSQDGLDLLLEAWAIVVREPDMTDAALELFGDGEARPALERQAARLDLGDRVRFHGYRKAAEFVPALAGCAVGVSPDPPTPFNDVSTMVKVVDYLAMGRGVVAFDLRETRTVAGDAAVIASPPTAEGLAEAIVGVLRDPELGRRLGEAGSARVASIGLDWSRSASALVEGYARILARTRARRGAADVDVEPGDGDGGSGHGAVR
jgi:glycosyltransferase involved in cell wall biosynthesis